MINDKLAEKIKEIEDVENIKIKAISNFICTQCSGNMIEICKRSFMQKIRGSITYKCDRCGYKHEYYQNNYY